MRTPSMDGAHTINFAWLLRLRWGAIVGQAAIILFVEWFLGIPLPLAALFTIIAIEIATNAGCALWARGRPEIREWMLAAVMALDILLLTALLYLTGGAFNPFSFLYLVHIALAAVVLRSLWTWALSGLALASFGLLFLVPVWVPFRELDEGGFHVDHMRMHLEGMWVAFGVAAGFIVYFVQRVTRALAAREAELLAARSLAARHEKLTSLATLAAGAAHELSTPLSTIAVVAKELERQLAPAGRAEVVADVHLIREQVRRCHDILQQMAAEAGEGAGEGISAVAIEDLVCTAIDGAVDPARVEISLAESARGRVLHVPPRALAQALRGVLKNAAQASPPVRKIRLHVACDDGSWRFQVRDEGSGMSADVLQRTGEPFFTTKSPGQGMGLGLFLTRAVLARLGGRLEIDSEPGGGTTAVLVLPEQPPRRGVDGTAVPTAA